ncbi:MAG: phage tail protein [Novosphingobium sp.]
MATLILSAVGQYFGGPIGSTIGALVGRQIDSLIFKPGDREGPRLNELKVTTSSYGVAIPRQFGRMRVAGQIIWATDLVEHREKQGNGKGNPSTVNYTYTASFAVALSSRPLRSIGRIWADGKLVRGAAGDMKVGGTFRFHAGGGNQAADPLLAAAEGAGRNPAYRGLAYVVFEDLQLADFGNRIPTLSFEVIADEAPLGFADLLSDVIEDVDADVPLPGLTGLSNEGSIGELLSALDPLFPVDCDACGDRLTIRPDRLQGAPIALSEAATSTKHEDFGGNAGFSRKRSPQSEQPVAALRYYDVDRDYQPGAQRASGRPFPGQPRTIELPAALDAGSARSLVESAARRVQWARQSISWRVTQLHPDVRPGATVTLPDHPGLWRVNAWEWHDQGIDLGLLRLSTHSGSANPADPGRAIPAPDEVIPTTEIVALELPWDGNNATPVPYLLAATSSASAAWAGASLYVDQGDGALQFLGAAGRSRATIGSAVDALPKASPLLFDRHSKVTIDLVAQDLTLVDATMRQMAMGVNRALIGGEVIQFASATPLGGGRWQLSGFLRGRGGTEASIDGHASGEPLVLLDGSGTALDPVAIGDTPEAMVAAIGLADNVAATSAIALRGIGGRPLSPVHAKFSQDTSGAVQLSWVRRSRGGWAWSDGVDLPLNEQNEAYTVTFGSGASIAATWECPNQNLTLSGAEYSSLMASIPLGNFAVRQRGDRGVSEPLYFPHPPTSH